MQHLSKIATIHKYSTNTIILSKVAIFLQYSKIAKLATICTNVLPKWSLFIKHIDFWNFHFLLKSQKYFFYRRTYEDVTKSPIVSPEESIPPPKYEEVMNQKVVIMVEDDNPPPSFEDVIKEE